MNLYNNKLYHKKQENYKNLILKINKKSFKITIAIYDGYLEINEINNLFYFKLELEFLFVEIKNDTVKIPEYKFVIYSFNKNEFLNLVELFSKRSILLNNIKYYYIFYNLLKITHFSQIYFVNDKKYRLNRICKIIKFKEKRLKEVYILKLFNNSNIIKIAQVFLHNNKIFLIFNLYKKINDFMNLRNSKIYPLICLRVIKGLINGLIELKKNNILHLDLSINNILFKRIDENMTELDVLIADFGISEIISSNIETIKCKGTKHFIDPFLLDNWIINWNPQNIKYIYSLDVYGLGSIFFYLITGDFFKSSKNYKLDIIKHLSKYDLDTNKIEDIINIFELTVEKDWMNRISIEELENHWLFENIY